MSPRSVEDERRAAAWLVGLAAVLLLLGALVVVREGSSGGQPDDEPAGEVIDRSAPTDADGDPAAPDEGEPGDVVEDAETSPDPATDAPPEDASAAPDEEDGAEAADAADSAALWGRWFRITEVREGDEAAEPVGDVPYLVGFAQEEGQDPERGALRWGGPCGTFAAEVAVAPEQLLVGEVSGAADDCDDERHAQDAAVTQLLAQSPAWSIEDGRLVLRSQDRALVLVEDPDVTPPPAP